MSILSGVNAKADKKYPVETGVFCLRDIFSGTLCSITMGDRNMGLKNVFSHNNSVF